MRTEQRELDAVSLMDRDRFRIEAVARAEDGTIEALEEPGKRFALGVLWHPEAGEDRRLFEELVREAAEYRRARGRPEG